MCINRWGIYGFVEYIIVKIRAGIYSVDQGPDKPTFICKGDKTKKLHKLHTIKYGKREVLIKSYSTVNVWIGLFTEFK